MFSPYYAWARRSGVAEPRNHCAVNVCLYGPRAKRWAMTERGSASLRQSERTLTIGNSRAHWDGEALSFDLDEVAAPIPSRIRGRVRVQPRALSRYSAPLDRAGRHVWQPIAPSARVEVKLDAPQLRWFGEAYVDSNRGSEPLEASLRDWHWSRGSALGESFVLYDVSALDGQRTTLAVAFNDDGEARQYAAPAEVSLPRSAWRLARSTRAEDRGARVERSFEDTPFYARSLISHRVQGRVLSSVHESLDLRRFASPIVQAMLPFRMPRRTVKPRDHR